MKPQDITIEDFSYGLAENRIPKYPLAQRDSSKLLVYKNESIHETTFNKLTEELAENTTLIFNDSRVIPVRMFFTTESGHPIEIFSLEPVENKNSNATVWKCFVGRLKKWKSGPLSQTQGDKKIEIELVGRESNYCLIEFTWSKTINSIFEVFETFGSIPIPPYLNRDTEEIDKERYQNVFAHNKGSVAAPTAGLHFTDSLLETLKESGTQIDFVTLHVGAGTFKPVQSDTLGGHEMHMERMLVTKEFIENIRQKISDKKSITAIGTTTLRTLESLYWLGDKLSKKPALTEQDLKVSQWSPYESEQESSVSTSLEAILNWMTENEKKLLLFTTELLITPAYKFRMIDSLITNFHQPKSTLLLLVAAAVGNDWQKIYQHALDNNFRFLSYGDSSLLFLNKENKA